MARFLRRQGQSRLRPPTIIGAAVTFRPVQVRLADPQRPGQVATRRGPHSKLRPPAVVGAAVTFRPLAVTLTNQQPASRAARKPHPRLSPPAIVGAATVFRPVAVKTVTQPRRYQHVVYKLRPPTVVGAATVFAPVKIGLARTRKTPIRSYPRMRTVIYPAGAAVATQEFGLLTMGVGV